MNLSRISGVINRYLFAGISDFNKVLNLIYWPAIDIFIWGFNSVWINKTTLDDKILLTMLTAASFWIIVYTTSQSISKSILEEIWSFNLVNLFSTPLKISEWITAILIVSLIDLTISFSVSLILIKIAYGVNILKVGSCIILFITLLIFSGWCLGFLAAGFLVYFGQRVESLPWLVGWVFVPFSSVFFPIDVLPTWAQKIASCLPMPYIFETMRNLIATNNLNWKLLFTGLMLNLFYLIISILFLIFMFKKSRILGLARLE